MVHLRNLQLAHGFNMCELCNQGSEKVLCDLCLLSVVGIKRAWLMPVDVVLCRNM